MIDETQKNEEGAVSSEEVVTTVSEESTSEDIEETTVESIDEDEEHQELSDLERLKEENKKLNSAVLRGRADLENFKKRSERERQDSLKFANKYLFEQILHVLDNFDRAMIAVKDSKDNFVIGVQMIQKQLQEVLTNNGVEEIDALGKPFDPYMHEAIAKEYSPDHPEHTILEVFQKGYRFKGQLLRPAKVKVADTEPEHGEETTDSL